MIDLVSGARHLADQLEKSAGVIRELCDALEGTDLSSLSPHPWAMSIRELRLSVRSRKCLERLKVKNVAQLCEKSANDLLNERNFGESSLVEVMETLAKMGLKLRMETAE